MPKDNNTGIQTRAMAKAQCREGGANQEQMHGAPNPETNPTVDPQRAKDEAIREFVRQQGKISLDWYVPNFCNT